MVGGAPKVSVNFHSLLSHFVVGKTSAGHFWASLHGLRGIAVLYVVVSHLGNLGLFLIPLGHDGIGKVGVWIFFGLSAFLLTSRLYSDLQSTGSKPLSILVYFVHRVFRIYPLYIAVLAARVLLGHMSVMEMFSHISLVAGHGELWAIPVEFKYYFIVPCVALVASALGVRYCVFFLVVAVLAAVNCGAWWPDSVFSNELLLFPKITPFLLGSILALVSNPDKISLRKAPGRLPSSISLLSPVALVVVTIAYRGLGKGWLPTDTAPWLSTAIGVSAVGLIHSGLGTNIVSLALRSRPLVFLGEISFSLYLTHMFVIGLINNMNILPAPLQAWLSIAVCVLCASVSYSVIERPGILAGKVISRRLQMSVCTRHGFDTANNENVIFKDKH